VLFAVMGAGGKTTTCLHAAKALSSGRVLLTTTTHIYPVEPPVCRELLIDPEEERLLQALEKTGIVCAGSRSKAGKLSCLPSDVLQAAAAKADTVIYEADGAAGRPLKLHRPTEPVFLPDTELCIVVAGLSALGQTVSEAVHCYELNEEWKNDPHRVVGEEEFLYCLRENIRLARESGGVLVLLNQSDTLTEPEVGRRLRDAVDRDDCVCLVLSLKKGERGDEP